VSHSSLTGRIDRAKHSAFVMAGLGPAIRVFTLLHVW